MDVSGFVFLVDFYYTFVRFLIDEEIEVLGRVWVDCGGGVRIKYS